MLLASSSAPTFTVTTTTRKDHGGAVVWPSCETVAFVIAGACLVASYLLTKWKPS